MNYVERRKRSLVAAVVLVALFAAIATSQARADDGPTVTVMTRNLYFGTSLDRVVAAPDQLSFFLAVADAFNRAQATDWAGRASRWADEIARNQPDLVGLQEAVQWRTQTPSDFSPIPDATTVAADFVQLLLDDLAARGLRYQVASEATGYDVEAPGLFTNRFTDVRLTQHEVILARVEGRMKLSNPRAGQYAAQISIPTAVGSIPLPWAWSSVDATISGHTFRFASTHLDPNAGPVQAAQAQEFLGGPGRTSLPLIWVGDFNSDADATKITGVPPTTETYGDLLVAGLSDGWAAVHPGDPGYSCCEAEDVLNPQPTLDQRIDLVLTRGPFRVERAGLVGNATQDWEALGRWPSDHAGLVATIGLG